MNFSGYCRGGPYDGQQLAHSRKEYRVAIAPPISYRDLQYKPPDQVVEIRFGHYHYVLGQWIWRLDGYHANR